MANTKAKEGEKFSYAEINKVVTAAANPDDKASRVPKETWEKYTKGNDPIVVVKKDEPPRVRADVYKAAMTAVKEDTRGAANAKEMLKNVNSLNKGQSEKNKDVERTNVLAVLEAKDKAKPVAREAFNEIRHLLDREKGGLSKEGMKAYGTDKEVMAAAKAQREDWEKNPVEKQKDQAADKKSTEKVVAKAADVLALLTAKPGEKPITDRNTYKKLVGTEEKPGIVDVHKKGGLTKEAFNAFNAAAEKGDEMAKKVVEAAAEHRKNFVKPAEKGGLTEENKKLVIAVLERRNPEQKPVTEKEFGEIKHLINPYKGTLVKKAEEEAKEKGMTDVIKANEDRKAYNTEKTAEKASAKAPEPAKEQAAER